MTIEYLKYYPRSKFLTNNTSQLAKAVTTVGCTIVLYVSIAKYAEHVIYLKSKYLHFQ